MQHVKFTPPRWIRDVGWLMLMVSACTSQKPASLSLAPSVVAEPCEEEALRERHEFTRRGDFSYGLHIAMQPNLIYHLDCLAGAVVCAQPIFREFWQSLGLDAEDLTLLGTWHDLRRSHGGDVTSLGAAIDELPLLAGSGVFDLAERQRIAGLIARTPSEYAMAMSLLTSHATAQSLRTILERFTPRFATYWQTQGFAAANRALDRFVDLVGDPFFNATLQKAATFYQAALPPGPTLDFHLVVQPPSNRRFSVAYQLERHAVIEVPVAGKAEELVDVLAHEIFRYFFSQMAKGVKKSLLVTACLSPDPQAVAAYGVLDEALATAIGNGIVGRHFQSEAAFAKQLERGLSANPAAAPVAKALLATMENFLERGVVVSSPEFRQAYAAAVASTYPNGQPRPLNYVHAHVAVGDETFAQAQQDLSDLSGAAFPYYRSFPALTSQAKAFLADHPYVTLALFAANDTLLSTRLEPLNLHPHDRKALVDHAQRVPAIVYAVKRTSKSFAFLFVGKDAAQMSDLVRSFATLTTVNEGVLVERGHAATP